MTTDKRKARGDRTPPAPAAAPTVDADVVQLVAEVLRPIQEGLPLQRREPPTVARVTSIYLEEHLKKQGRALGTCESAAACFRWFLEVLPTPYPTAGQVQQALQARIDAKTLKETTANKYKQYLGAAYRYARNFWPLMVVRDPTAGVRNWEVPERKPRSMADPVGTFHRLLAEACKDDTERALLAFLFLFALRISEARGLRWDRDLSPGYRQVEVQAQRVARRKGETNLKTRASHARFDVPDFCKGLLRSMWRERQRVLKEGGTPWQVRDARSPYLFNYGQARLHGLMGRIRAIAPEDFPEEDETQGALAFHCFRDSMGAILASLDTSAKDGKKALRHSKEETAELYFNNLKGKPTTNAALLGAQALITGGLPTAGKGGGLHLVK